jgi:hypothetical protein
VPGLPYVFDHRVLMSSYSAASNVAAGVGCSSLPAVRVGRHSAPVVSWWNSSGWPGRRWQGPRGRPNTPGMVWPQVSARVAAGVGWSSAVMVGQG